MKSSTASRLATTFLAALAGVFFLSSTSPARAEAFVMTAAFRIHLAATA
jgi:hypothetical protein